MGIFYCRLVKLTNGAFVSVKKPPPKKTWKVQYRFLFFVLSFSSIFLLGLYLSVLWYLISSILWYIRLVCIFPLYGISFHQFYDTLGERKFISMWSFKWECQIGWRSRTVCCEDLGSEITNWTWSRRASILFLWEGIFFEICILFKRQLKNS